MRRAVGWGGSGRQLPRTRLRSLSVLGGFFGVFSSGQRICSGALCRCQPLCVPGRCGGGSLPFPSKRWSVSVHTKLVKRRAKRSLPAAEICFLYELGSGNTGLHTKLLPWPAVTSDGTLLPAAAGVALRKHRFLVSSAAGAERRTHRGEGFSQQMRPMFLGLVPSTKSVVISRAVSEWKLPARSRRSAGARFPVA